jgi:hypothetical protein
MDIAQPDGKKRDFSSFLLKFISRLKFICDYKFYLLNIFSESVMFRRCFTCQRI